MNPHVINISRRNGAPSSASRGTAVVVAKPIPFPLRFSLLLFAFTLPIETLTVALNLGSTSVSKYAGLLFFGVTLFYFGRCYSVLSPPLWCFFAYIAAFALLGLLVEPSYDSDILVDLFTRIQIVMFFWAASNLLRDNDLSRKVLLAFAFGAVLFGTAAQLGLGGFAVGGNSRSSALGFNPDYLGLIFAAAGTILVGFTLEKLSKVYLLPALAIALSMIVVSGARGSVIAFVFGVACYLLPMEINFRKVVAITVATLALVMMGYLVMTNPAFIERWNRTLNEGDTAGRDELLVLALGMVRESPLVGWGPNSYQYELEERFHGYRGLSQSSHNLELDALIEGGILGGGPFLLGIALCCRSAWKNRSGELGILPLAALVTILVNAQFIPYAVSKPLWLLLAVCAPTIRFSSRRSRQPLKYTNRSVRPGVFRPAASHPRQSL